MSFDFPDPTEAPRPATRTRRRPRALLPTLGILVVLILAFGLFAGFWTDWMWFSSLGYTSVIRTELVTKVVLFVVLGALFAALVLSNAVLARRLQPGPLERGPEDAVLARYRNAVEPYRRIILGAAGVVLALFAGSSAAGEWRTWLLWRNAVPFGQKDPQFGVDVSFFAFSLPWWRFLVGFGFAVVVVSLIVAALSHWLYGGLRTQGGPGSRTSVAARVHLSVLLGIFVLLKAISYWLDRYTLAIADGQVGKEDFTGLRYVDVNAILPGKTILAVIALICAVLFFATAFTRSWLLPGVGVALLLLSAILVGGIYPAAVQYFQVRPNEATKESPYLSRYIAGTRTAYEIADAKVTQYQATTKVEPGQLKDDAATIPGIRLLDPSLVSPTYRQLQQIKQYYTFPDSLDIDRYQLSGKERDAVVALREIDLAGVPAGQRNWINDHLFYTHGFGFVGAYGNTVDSDGNPSFFESNIPPTGALGDFQPRIYFGENSPEYSIVGAPAGAKPGELDYPNDAVQSGQALYTYTGQGGVPVGSWWNRLLFATRFQESNILLSNAINPASRILFDREPRDRVEKVAPWLTVDGDPYPAVVNNRIVWILDGYTTSDAYPYSHHTTLQDATTDTLTQRSSAVSAQPQAEINYIRNSVKATVDAYDGTVTLYAWDESDPVLKAWENAFPGTVKPKSAISDALMAHLRFPEDFFKVQRTLLAQFHVQDPQAFYGGQDFWKVPNDPTVSDANVDQPPYYLTLQMPGSDKAHFSLTSTYVPRGNRDNLTAFVAVNAEPGKDYGQIEVLQVPSSTTINGPAQVQNKFESDVEVSRTLSLLRSGGSEVLLGNLLTLPVGGGLLYVEPVYVQAKGNGSYPLLQKVLVSFGDQIAFEDNLQKALDTVFAGNAGASTGAPGSTPTPSPSPSPSGSPSPTPSAGPTGSAQAQLATALADAQQAIKDADAALKAGDFAKYGEAQQRLKDAINRALAAEKAGAVPPAGSSGTSSTPAPGPSSAPTSGPTAAPSAAPSATASGAAA